MKNTNVQEILSRGKDKLIQEARDQIKKRVPELTLNYEEYEASIWVNNEEVIVKFRRLIRYEIKDEHYYYDLSVNLVSGEIRPFDDILYKDNFFIPTEEQDSVIAYLTELCGLPDRNMDNIISEEEEYYWVSLHSETAYRITLINKETGEQLEPLEGSYILPPSEPGTIEEDPLKEVKWDE